MLLLCSVRAKMSCKVLLVVALSAVSASCLVLSENANPATKEGTKATIQRQIDLMELYANIHEPLTGKKYEDILKTWTLEANVNEFENVTAAKTYAGMIKYKWHLPRSVPYSPYEPAHNFETFTLFNVLSTAKSYDTFYKTAVYLRNIVNEDLYVYVLYVATLFHPDTPMVFPPIYDVMPSYFHYGEVMNLLNRIETLGSDFAKNYPAVHGVDGKAVLIMTNQTEWPYSDSISPIKYYTNDVGLNAVYYYMNVLNPYWLNATGEERAEWWYNSHKQLVARYYLERLSAGLGEIPEITDYIPEGYSSGLVYENGIPFPSRPDNYYIDYEKYASELEEIKEFERRIWEAIDKGFYVDKEGKHVSLRTEASFDDLSNLIQSNAASPNSQYYKDFIRLWKIVIGNSYSHSRDYAHDFAPLVVPSALENYQTALRDPAFYMIWKRVLRLFNYWQKQMGSYTPEELSSPGIVLEKVEVDKLVTFFDMSILNLTNYLSEEPDHIVGAAHFRLNHRPFNISLTIKSDTAKTVIAKFFLAPKYDSKGKEIPLHLNTQNFFFCNEATFDLVAGENVLVRKSSDMFYGLDDWDTAGQVYQDLLNGEWEFNHKKNIRGFPRRLLLPKGHVSGFPLQFITFVYEFNHIYPMGYPANRPLYNFQVAGLKNMKIQDINIYHIDDSVETYVLNF